MFLDIYHSCLTLDHNQKDLAFIKELIESGKIIPVIDGCYPLSKTPEAFWYFEKVHPRGKVVITIEQEYSFLKEVQNERNPNIGSN